MTVLFWYFPLIIFSGSCDIVFPVRETQALEGRSCSLLPRKSKRKRVPVDTDYTM